MITASSFLLFAGIVMVVLLGLTLRSVMLRDRAMVKPREDTIVRTAYEERWRGAA